MLKNLVLTRPLVFLDLETTGVDPEKDRIVEFCFRAVFPKPSVNEVTGVTLHHFVNPCYPISAEATAVHGITDAIADCWKPFSEYARTALLFLDGCDLAGFGIKRFDLKLLVAEFRRQGLEFKLAGRHIIDVMEIYHQRERRDLNAAMNFYCGCDLDDAHQADADVEAAMLVLDCQIKKYKLTSDVELLASETRRKGELDIAGNFISDNSVVRFNFGKHKGASVMAVPISYLTWFLGESFFDDAKAIVQFEFDRRQAKQKNLESASLFADSQ